MISSFRKEGLNGGRSFMLVSNKPISATSDLIAFNLDGRELTACYLFPAHQHIITLHGKCSLLAPRTRSLIPFVRPHAQKSNSLTSPRTFSLKHSYFHHLSSGRHSVFRFAICSDIAYFYAILDSFNEKEKGRNSRRMNSNKPKFSRS